MKRAIVIAWRDLGCPYRRESFAFCHAHWQKIFPKTPIVIGDAEPFSRAAAINAGIRQAVEEHDAEIIFQPDPDTLLDELMVFSALKMAEDRDGIVNPYSTYLYLTKDASREILDGAWRGGYHTGHAEYGGPGGSGLAAVYSVSTWEKAGGFDENFGVWGGDDGAFAFAAHYLAAPGRRTPGYAWHLWHPWHPDSQVGSPGYLAQMTILEKYRDAHSADAIRAVIEGRT